jgi:non-ribosomal peptide synthetase component E (peptide arylation enzyme)
VIGIPDEVLGEVGVAVVVAREGAVPDLLDLRWHCTRQLADYKAPDALVLVDELPLTPMMKVDPKRLKQLAAQGLAEGRAQVVRGRGSAAGVLGSDPVEAAEQEERE